MYHDLGLPSRLLLDSTLDWTLGLDLQLQRTRIPDFTLQRTGEEKQSLSRTLIFLPKTSSSSFLAALKTRDGTPICEAPNSIYLRSSFPPRGPRAGTPPPSHRGAKGRASTRRYSDTHARNLKLEAAPAFSVSTCTRISNYGTSLRWV